MAAVPAVEPEGVAIHSANRSQKRRNSEAVEESEKSIELSDSRPPRKKLKLERGNIESSECQHVGEENSSNADIENTKANNSAESESNDNVNRSHCSHKDKDNGMFEYFAKHGIEKSWSPAILDKESVFFALARIGDYNGIRTICKQQLKLPDLAITYIAAFVSAKVQKETLKSNQCPTK